MKYNDQEYNEIMDYALHLINSNKVSLKELRNNLRKNSYPEDIINRLTLDILDNHLIYNNQNIIITNNFPLIFRNKYLNFIMYEFSFPLVIIFTSQYSSIINNKYYLYFFIILFVISLAVDKYYLAKLKHTFPDNIFTYLLKIMIQFVITVIVFLFITY